MEPKAVKYLLLGQAVLWLSLLVNSLLLPSIVYSNLGISNFGIHARTILPYGIGFLLCGFLTFMAAHSIERKDFVTSTLNRALSLLALFLIGVLLTPYSLSTFFDLSHMAVGGLLFLFELGFAAWLVRLRPDNVNYLLFTLQYFGTALAALSLLEAFDLMFAGQLTAEAAFGTLLVRTAAHVLGRPQPTAPELNDGQEQATKTTR